MEYKESFLKGQINFFSFIGPTCPICGDPHCYREVTPYWRYAIELFPGFKKERIPISRFLCRSRRVTFSLLPIQLIPYFQYTVRAVIGTLLLGFRSWQMGKRGFFGAMVAVDPDSEVTPWLVAFWLATVLQGLRRGHAVLGRFYDLRGLRTSHRTDAWEEVASYFVAFGWKPQMPCGPLLLGILRHYSRATRLFLFGTASQYRSSISR